MYIALLLLMLCPSIALAGAAGEPSFESISRLNDLLHGTPHFFYVDFGNAADGTKGELVVICDEPTPEIMSRTPKTYGGYPVKIEILKEWQEYWKYSFPGDVPPGCTNDNRRLVCPKAKPVIIDPTPGEMARDPRYPECWIFGVSGMPTIHISRLSRAGSCAMTANAGARRILQRTPACR
jgi:hypothetical protein